MSHCKKFTPNIFNKIKCSNCFRQKEEHSAEALECNRACRSIARSGYLFVAPDWDFSVPLNRTKRWQRRWFVLYDDGELNYSVDEHPDTVPQGSVDMTKVLEVTGAEQVTGHPHSLALTGPDRVTFVKATSREETRWWAELLAVFPRRHKRNATFPGGRASPSLPQLGRSASPQPPRPRHLSCTGPSPRTNFTTPPLKEERESPAKEDVRSCRHDAVPTAPLPIEQITPSSRNDYVVSSGSPPTRDKLRCEDKARARQDWRNERLRDIATALTDRSPESSLALPAEGLLNLKKGWLWFQHSPNEWMKLWWVLCEPTLTAYEKEQDEQGVPLISVELSSVTHCCEIQTDTRYGFQIQWSGPVLILSAVTEGIRSNWLKALKRATPTIERNLPSPSSVPATPRSALLSSDEEYRTASEGGRRDSEDWGDYNPTSPVPKTLMTRMKDRARLRPKLPRCHSRQSTLDSVSTDELDGFKDEDNTKQSIELNELRRQLSIATADVQNLEAEVVRLKNLQAETHDREKQARERLTALERTEKDLSQKIRLADDKYNHEQKTWQRRISDYERSSRESEDRCSSLSRELQAKQRIAASLQEELNCVNERMTQTRIDNDRLYKKLQEIEGKNIGRSKRMASLTDLTDIDLEIDLETLNQNELIEQCLDLRSRFEKAVIEIRAVKRELRESHVKYDELELQNVGLKRSLEMVEQESQAHATLMADRVQDLTNKLAAVEKQARTLKSKLQDSREKRRSLSLKGRENFSINKEVEDKVTELEAKILSLERGRSRRKHRRDRSVENASPIDDKTLRRLRRKSLDSATSSEPMKLLMRLTTLESKVNQVNTSNESLTQNPSVIELNKTDDFTNNLTADDIIKLAREKVGECQHTLGMLRSKKRAPSPSVDRYSVLETGLVELGDILGMKITGTEYNVVNTSVKGVVKQLEGMLREKLLALEEKKNSLRENGRLDQNSKMEIFAEKIAYENLIIGRIEEAVKFHTNTDTNCDRLFGKETIETANMIAKLQSKLTDGASKENPTLISSLDHLTKVLTKRLLYQSHNLTYPPKNPVKNLSLAINYLEEEQNKLTNTLNVYKTQKLPLLADALALETLSLSMDESCRLQENTISDTWCAAREIVNSELITSEINHVLMRTAQNYESTSSSDQSFFFTFFAFDRAVLELWSDSVENTLRSEMERYIDELNDLYRNSLTKLQRQNWRRKLENERSNKNHTVLLKEYADVIAHKSLIDARISVLRGECVEASAENRGDNNFVMTLFELESYWDCLQNLGLVDVSKSLEAEFKLIMDRTTCEARNDVFYDQDFRRVRTAVANLYSEIKELRGALGAGVDENDNSLLYSMDDVCMKCREMRRLVKDVKESVADLQSKSDLSENRVPLYLGTEYLNQVENLRAAYRKTLEECESHKQQVDLEELQILCERVLVAMEHWHRRTLQDLRETHSKELQALRQDKEQALAEETQATLAALDAMRKAHEAEVQREVARFKQDFAREQQNELQQLNEQLSVKCLEAAALQEQLGSATRQLSHAQQHILQLQRNSHISTQN